jgi:hypothetical protein
MNIANTAIVSTRRRLWILGCVAIALSVLVVSFMAQSPALAATTWNEGDVFVGLGDGSYQVYSNDGVFKETIDTGLGGFATGCAFNPDESLLYTTAFSATKVVVFDNDSPHDIVQVVNTGAVSPNGHSESVVFAKNGDFYVGHPDGPQNLIHKYDPAGNLLATYAVAADTDGLPPFPGGEPRDRGSDWIDLAADQSTIFYTSEGRAIQRFDVNANTQLPNFATLPGVLVDGPNNAFALRLLPPWDGSGGLLVADRSNIKRLDANGNVVQTYGVQSVNTWFALNLDPNGTSFWSADGISGDFYRFNIQTGEVEVGPIDTGTGGVFGLCVKGELSGGVTPPPTSARGRMMGGGSAFASTGARVTHGFELHCNVTDVPNNLQVNWKGKQFNLTTLTSASCSDDPSITPSPPNSAGFDTYSGEGSGKLNGKPGASAEWVFTDAGEPGTRDTVTMSVMNQSNVVVLTVSGHLRLGDQQALAE